MYGDLYAIGLIDLGNNDMIVPAGNDGMQRLHNKTMRGWLSETSVMRNCVDRLYVVNDFTQAMCEMNPSELAEYVLKHQLCKLK